MQLNGKDLHSCESSKALKAHLLTTKNMEIVLHTAKTVVPSYIQLHRFSLDYGMDPRVREHPPFRPEAVFLSHAHLDHCGSLPLLEDAVIYSTTATKEVARLLLLDAVKVMKERYETPLFSEDDVNRIMKNFRTVDRYGDSVSTDLGEVFFYDAGHILGSSIIYFEDLNLLYTGDLGHGKSLLLSRPQFIQADTLIIEGTYAGKKHPKQNPEDEFAKIINSTKGKILIPVFAVGRSQEVLYIIKKLKESGRIPDVKVYFDSPLAQSVTYLYRSFMYYLKPEFRGVFLKGEDPFKFEGLEYVKSFNRSLEIAESDERCIILASSGMLEGGRALNHLPKILQDKNSAVVFVGYQAKNTLGRIVLESKEGEEIPLEDKRVKRLCRIYHIQSLSSHADHDDLVKYVVKTGARRVVITHSENPEILAEYLRKFGINVIYAEKPGKKIPIKRKKRLKEEIILKVNPQFYGISEDVEVYPKPVILVKRNGRIEIVSTDEYKSILESIVPKVSRAESKDGLEKLLRVATKNQIRKILAEVEMGEITSCEGVISFANLQFSKKRISKEFRDVLVELANSHDFSSLISLFYKFLEVK